MNKLFATFFLFLFNIGAQAQYYYKDIVSNKQLTTDMATYKQKKIHKIKTKSFEEDGTPSEGFLCEKTISKDFRSSELFTRTNISATSLFTSVFNDKGQLLNSSDSSEITVSRNYYTYDVSGRLQKIVSSATSSDDDFANELLEEHIYEYNSAGVPLSMIRVKNRRDSTKILFQVDDKGNLAIEKDTKTGQKYYYYYDEKNRLTDVAHTSEYRENLVADYVFEYDQEGMMNQMTVTEEGRGKEHADAAPNFFIWRYINENGLRTKEALFSSDRKLLGSIEYEYN
ncbi:MAG: hypothetical protein ABI402_04865 [Ferruginibacter sp.]